MATKNISFPKRAGRASRQAHVNFPEGTFEREIGRDGFFGPATQMYHSHPPTGWVSWSGPLRPHCFDLNRMADGGSCYWDTPTILHNNSVGVRRWVTSGKMDHLVRNGDGDELLFMHEGSGSLFCDYGHLEYEAGDYIITPRSTMWRIEACEKTTILGIESTNGSYKLPDRGLIGNRAQFDMGVLDTPEMDEAFLAQQDEKEWSVQIKCRNQVSTIVYPFNPLDAVGWQGDLVPIRLNVRDIRPINSHRYHLPPSAHTTWVGNRFVICTFVPRPFETDADALKVPYFHNNDDYDEVLFYHSGNFFSRDNIDTGMMTWHPCGFTHGPHPKALQNMFKAKNPMSDEIAVMLDTRDPLEAGEGALDVELQDYADSWRAKDGPVKAPKIPTPDND